MTREDLAKMYLDTCAKQPYGLRTFIDAFPDTCRQRAQEIQEIPANIVVAIDHAERSGAYILIWPSLRGIWITVEDADMTGVALTLAGFRPYDTDATSYEIFGSFPVNGPATWGPTQ